jgi:hypothetical protein
MTADMGTIERKESAIMTQTYTLQQAANALGISAPTLRKWRYAGKMVPPIDDDDFVLRWDEDAIRTMQERGPAPAGTYPVEKRQRRKRSTSINFRSLPLVEPLAERTPPGETASTTGRWIIEQYLEFMATANASGDEEPDYYALGERLHKDDIERCMSVVRSGKDLEFS